MKRDEKKPKQKVVSISLVTMIEDPSQQIGYNQFTYIKLKRN